MNTDCIKEKLGNYIVNNFIKSNTRIGLGTGSTMKYVIEELGIKIQQGVYSNIICVPTSISTEILAKLYKIPLGTLDQYPQLDMAIDGADEVNSSLDLIKGRGGALLREKIVAKSSDKFIVAVDETKLFPEGLGLSGAFPIEVVEFGVHNTIKEIVTLPSLGLSTWKIRTNPSSGEYFKSDNNNLIVDIYLNERIKDCTSLSNDIKSITGVVDHGLFLGMTSVCVIGYKDGTIQIKTKD